MVKFQKMLIVMLVLTSLLACRRGEKSFGAQEQEGIKKREQTAKYVFLFIGDGLGIPQRVAAEQYSGRELVMNTLPAQGVTTTQANDRFITGSAAAATAIASGKKTNIGFIGMDANLKPMKTLAEMAKEQGKRVGIISTVSIDHATPAAFYAHVPSRKMYHEIDHALAESGFDFFGGGGLLDPSGKKSKAPLGDAIAKAKTNGYTFIDTREEFESLGKNAGKVVVENQWLQDDQAMPYSMDMTRADITLPELTAKATELLDNSNGFFLMVEGGKIDWACHANDGMASIKNTLSFDESIQVALDFYKKHPEQTLIVVTGDHECGGLTLGFAGTQYASFFDILKNQKVSFQKFQDEILPKFKVKSGTFAQMQPIIEQNFGLKFTGDSKKNLLVLADYEKEAISKAFNRSMKNEKTKSGTADYILYGDYDPLTVTLTHILNNKAGLAWTSYKHTGVPVNTSAIGVDASEFNGYYDNTDIALKIMKIMGAENRAKYSAISTLGSNCVAQF